MDALMLKEIKVQNADFGFPIYQKVHFSSDSDHASLIGKLSIMLEIAE